MNSFIIYSAKSLCYLGIALSSRCFDSLLVICPVRKMHAPSSEIANKRLEYLSLPISVALQKMCTHRDIVSVLSVISWLRILQRVIQTLKDQSFQKDVISNNPFSCPQMKKATAVTLVRRKALSVRAWVFFLLCTWYKHQTQHQELIRGPLPSCFDIVASSLTSPPLSDLVTFLVCWSCGEADRVEAQIN